MHQLASVSLNKPVLANQDELLAKFEQEVSEKEPSEYVLAKCAICEMRPRGLVYICLHCKHGGHYEHYLQWASLQRRKNGTYPVPCPTGCGCTHCFKEFSYEVQQQAMPVDELFDSPERKPTVLFR